MCRSFSFVESPLTKGALWHGPLGKRGLATTNFLAFGWTRHPYWHFRVGLLLRFAILTKDGLKQAHYRVGKVQQFHLSVSCNPKPNWLWFSRETVGHHQINSVVLKKAS